MSNASLKLATLTKGLLLCFSVLLALNIITVFIDANQLGKEMYDTRKEIEHIETVIMSSEHCFPNCETQFASNERWKSLQQRLAYYKDADERGFFDRLGEEVLDSDIDYIVVFIIFLILTIASKLRRV